MFLKKLLRKVIVLALIVGLGWGCISLYGEKTKKQNKIDNAFATAYDALVEELAKDTPDETEAIRQGAVMRAMYQESNYRKDADLTILVEALYSASANPSELPVNEETKNIFLKVTERPKPYSKMFAEQSVRAAVERVEAIRSVLK